MRYRLLPDATFLIVRHVHAPARSSPAPPLFALLDAAEPLDCDEIVMTRRGDRMRRHVPLVPVHEARA
jgi:hypothetical protein